jgi:putrescine transport system permease protein
MKQTLRNGILVVGYLFIYLPLIFLVVFSFNQSKLPGIWTCSSLKWYRELFEDELLIQATLTSLKIASLSATFSVLLGLFAVFCKHQKKIKTVSSLMLTMPDLILALSILFVFIAIEKNFGLQRNSFALIAGHMTLSFSYTYLMIKARIKDFDPSLEEAALNLGAKPLRVFFAIKAPFLVPALLTSWFLAFALSFDDVILASFLAGPSTTTLPLVIFSSLRLGISPEINALASILILIITFLLLIVIFYLMWFEKKRKIKYKKI